MPSHLPKPGSGALARRIGLGFELVDELIELVEVDPGSEPEGMRNGFRSRAPTRLGPLAETGPQRPVDHVLEGQPELARLSLQEPSEIIVNGECSAHERHLGCE
jgi:hypothetical protein